MLSTHRGLSGPAILQVSSYWKKEQPILLDLAPEGEVAALLLQPSSPRTVAALRELEHQVHRCAVFPAGTEGYAKAEVTVGGVDTDELSAKTMESRKVPGLFFIGEVVDVTGHLGGFNFQWAWASGACAGRAL